MYVCYQARLIACDVTMQKHALSLMQIADVAAEATFNPEFNRFGLNEADTPAFVVAHHSDSSAEPLSAQVIVLKKPKLN